MIGSVSVVDLHSVTKHHWAYKGSEGKCYGHYTFVDR